MKRNNSSDYMLTTNYFKFLVNSIKQVEIFTVFSEIYKKLHKLTLISAIIKILSSVASLVEKSAFFLLFFTIFIFAVPIVLGVILIAFLMAFIKYFILHKSVYPWLKSANKITFYLSCERIFDEPHNPLFLRMAKDEASMHDHPVIVLTNDLFISAKWYSVNLLAIRSDYFFLIKKLYLPKIKSKSIFICCS